MSAVLTHLLQNNLVWPGAAHAAPVEGIDTGFPALNAALGGGWPKGALTEILYSQIGVGELQLLMPALAALSQRQWIAWIGAPYIPYAPGLVQAGINLAQCFFVRAETHNRAWTLEQALRSGVCGAGLAWPAELTPKSLRRLQLAAEEGGASGFLFRPRSVEQETTTAALRIALERRGDDLAVHVLKRRGGWSRAPLLLSLRARVGQPGMSFRPSAKSRVVPQPG